MKIQDVNYIYLSKTNIEKETFFKIIDIIRALVKTFDEVLDEIYDEWETLKIIMIDNIISYVSLFNLFDQFIYNYFEFIINTNELKYKKSFWNFNILTSYED